LEEIHSGPNQIQFEIANFWYPKLLLKIGNGGVPQNEPKEKPPPFPAGGLMI